MCYDLTTLHFRLFTWGKNHRLFTKIGQYNNIICPLKAAWRVASDKNLLVVCLLSLCTSLYAVIISKDGDILSIILHCMRASTFLIFVQARGHGAQQRGHAFHITNIFNVNAPTVRRYGADPLMFRSGGWVRGSGRSLS